MSRRASASSKSSLSLLTWSGSASISFAVLTAKKYENLYY